MEGDYATAAKFDEDADDGAEETEILEEEDAAAVAPDENAEFDPLAFLHKFHPETILDYAETIAPQIPLSSVPPTDDSAHTSQPFLTLYEKTKILGFRANQIAQGAAPYIAVPAFIRDVTEIARLELEARRLPYIVKRPMPDGTFEYWRLSEMMVI
jgi:DNA-directed RNA polymerase I, II, and III subunit RPABC2